MSPPRVTVVFRYDDYSSRSNIDLEKKILRAFSRNRACCTFSIIPFISAVDYLDTKPQEVIPLTAAKAEIARQAMAAGTMDAAQHGYSHQRQGYTHGWYTAYEGLDYDSQLHKIRLGKVFLEKILGANIITFVPPYNSYDANTLKVLEKLNFRCTRPTSGGKRFLLFPKNNTCDLYPASIEGGYWIYRAENGGLPSDYLCHVPSI